MMPEAFVGELDAENRALLEKLGAKSQAGEAPGSLSVRQLLKLALRNELEASELAALWMADTKELDAKLALARQCGDEAKHYRWIEERLRALGEDLSSFDPAAQGDSPLLKHLKSLKGTVERAAAGQFTREAIAVVRNDVFARFCEEHHHELGRRLLLRYATSDELQAKARAAARRTLEVAEEVQEMARMKMGVCRAPGC